MGHGIHRATISRRCMPRIRLGLMHTRFVAFVILSLVGFGTLISLLFLASGLESLDAKEDASHAHRINASKSGTKSSPIVHTSNSAALFHRARNDRSGAVIQDMLLAHAYSLQQNQTYGGACFNETGAHPRIQSHIRMIAALGLSHVLQLACPSEPHHRWMDSHLFTRFGTRLWTPAWLSHIRSQQQGIGTLKRRRSSVVAHVRRGDVSLCDPTTRDRYLPNAYYLSLLEKYATVGNVTIYSESQSSEEWSMFEGYDLQLDQSPAEAWQAMIMADVLILSKSSFSIVPAIFNQHGVIVYTPFWVLPLPEWSVVDDNSARSAARTVLRLQSQHCDTN
jgi:hypothetical protein